MATNKKRLNITLTPDSEKAVAILAKRDHVPRSRKVRELLTIALEIEEDELLDTIAEGRDRENAHFYPHDDVWQ